MSLGRLWRIARPFPRVDQLEAFDCGPAAVLAILRYWGGNTTLSEVRALAGTDASGSSLAGLGSAARAIGLDPVAATGTYEDLRRERLPCIAHLTLPDGLQHFVVVRRVHRRGVVLADPAGRMNRVSRRDFEAVWRSRAVLLLSPTAPGSLRCAPRSPWFVWIARYGRSEPGWLAQSVFLGVVSSGAALLTALFIRTLIDRLIVARDVGLILSASGLLFLLLVGRAAADHARTIFSIHLGRSAGSHTLQDLLAHLFGQDAAFFACRPIGDLTARIRSAIPLYRGLVESASIILVDGLILTGSLAFLLILAPEMAPIPLVILPLHAVMATRRAARIRRKHMLTLSALGGAESTLTDGLRGAGDIRACGIAAPFARRVGGHFEDLLDRVEALEETQAGLGLVSGVSASLVVVASLSIGAIHVIAGDLLVGELMAGYSLLTGGVGSVNRIVGALVRVEELEGAALRARDLMIAGRRAGPSPEPPLVRRGIRLELTGDLAFFTNEGPKSVLIFPAGAITGISGPSGVGKTTLIQLLAGERFDDGVLFVDGRRVDELSLSSYRRRIGALSASTHVFRGTLGYNVSLDRVAPETSGERLPAMLDRLAPFLRRFPGRWQTPLGEGYRSLSTGERQVVGLLRALASDPKVLLIDEGLSGMDSELREAVLSALHDFARDRVVVVASHDQSVLEIADRVIGLRGPPSVRSRASRASGR